MFRAWQHGEHQLLFVSSSSRSTSVWCSAHREARYWTAKALTRACWHRTGAALTVHGRVAPQNHAHFCHISGHHRRHDRFLTMPKKVLSVLEHIILTRTKPWAGFEIARTPFCILLPRARTEESHPAADRSEQTSPCFRVVLTWALPSSWAFAKQRDIASPNENCVLCSLYQPVQRWAGRSFTPDLLIAR